MVPSFIATLLFAFSVVAAGRSAAILGSNTANFWRLVVATVVLGLWAHLAGLGLGGGALGWFLLSGAVGFGIGDFALFQMLPRLGPRLSCLMINCLAAPFAAGVEWGWLGTRLSAIQLLWGGVILIGVGFSMMPEAHVPIPRRRRLVGIVFGLVAAFGQGFGAVLARRAYAVVADHGSYVDGGTAAYQRILGGLAVIALPSAWFWWRARDRERSEGGTVSDQDRSIATRWVVLNALAGPALGVAFFQWALQTTPSGIVLSITAMSPLAVIPLAFWLDGDRPGWRSLVGGILAVAGVIGLTMAR